MNKKPPADVGLEDLDWDAAIAEWEQSTLVPEVARDKGSPPALEAIEKRPPAAGTPPPPHDSATRRPAAPTEGPSVLAATAAASQTAALRSSSAPRVSRGGLDQLFRSRPPSPIPSDPATRDTLDFEIEETVRRHGAIGPGIPPTPPPPTPPPPTPPPSAAPAAKVPTEQDIEDELSATLAKPRSGAPEVAIAPDLDDGADIDALLARSDEAAIDDAETLANLPGSDDDAPTQALKGSSSSPRIEPPRPQQPAPRAAAEISRTHTFVRRPKDEDDAPTRLRPRSEYPSTRPPDETDEEPPAPRTFDDEHAAVEVIDEENRAALLERAAWFETEARSMTDAGLAARTLLTASELRAMCGDPEEAARLAAEAREIEPRLPLAHWQARALLSRDAGDLLVTALDAEARHASTPAHRLHAVLLGAEHLRASGDTENAAQHLDHAATIAPDDARAATARAASALARRDYAHPGLRVGHASQLAPLSLAIGTVLRLRGVELPDGDAGAFLANDSLRRARVALEQGDLATAAKRIAELRSIPEIARGAGWLAAALGTMRPETQAPAAQWLQQLIGPGGGDEALVRRALAAHGVETGNGRMVEAAFTGDETFGPHERALLAALMRLPLPRSEAELDALASSDGMEALAAAIAGIALPSSPEEARTRARRTCGRSSTKKLVALGRLLGTGAPDEDLEAVVKDAEGEDGVSPVALELAARAGRYDEVSVRLAAWSKDAEPDAVPIRQLAAALVAERAGQRDQASAAYRAARAADPACEPAVRALLELEGETDATIALAGLADAVTDPLRGALIRLEAVSRTPEVDAADTAGALEHVHKAAPSLPFAAFLAERIARKTGNVEETLRWIRERRARTTDPLEGALDAVREALLVVDTEPALAAERIAEAHGARPEDVALRELHERLAIDPPTDRGAWREGRARKATGPSQALLFVEAAYEHERVGDEEGCLRAAQAACAAGDAGLGRLALERAEVEGGSAARLADELLEVARSTEDVRARREAYERLADLDAVGRGDPASALLWHRSILEFEPAWKPSLRYIEHAFVSAGRDDELEPIATSIARALAGTAGGECAAHAELAARLRLRGESAWETTRDMVELACAQAAPPLWSLRRNNAHARARKDDAQVLATTRALAAKTTRTAELAVLHLRAAEAAERLERVEEARDLLERATQEDPGDVVTWGLLAELRQRLGDARGAGEAGEALARTSFEPRHQLLAWYDSARIWQDDVKDADRALPCLEQAAAIDVTHEDVFPRLSALYAQRGAREELAALLEKRIASITSPEERVELEVERGKALVDVGDADGARTALKAALAEKPDHVVALRIYGDLCASVADWDGAEQTWVRLARSLTATDEQRDVYKKLGELYAVHAVNLSRAEVAFKEVLKRAPGDAVTVERLVDVYARQKDGPRAIEAQQQLITLATDPVERRARIIRLAAIYDEVARDGRKAEQTLEAARREAPTDVSILRALALFYTRHKQGPAVNILLDRASGDARRALAAGRFTPAAFEMLQTVFEVRGRNDAARVVGATLAAFEGRQAALRGGDARAGDPRLDDFLAPELLTPALRALLARAGDALDVASPLDLRSLHATQLPANAATLHQSIARLAQGLGIGQVQALVSTQLARTCVPASSSAATIVLGDSLLSAPNELAREFLIVRALKLVQARASALVRAPAADMAVLFAAWLRLFNPQWQPEGLKPTAVADAARRVQAGLPRQLPPDVGLIALEVAGSVGAQGAALGAAAISWANRAALLAVGDMCAAFDAIAWSTGMKDGAPTGADERRAWATRTVEIKDLLSFSVTDGYAEARSRLGLDRV